MTAPQPGDDLHINIGTSFTSATQVHTNMSQQVIVTTRDKIELALRRTLPSYTSTEQLLASLSLTAGLFLALFTADFRKAMGVSPDGWKAIFALVAVVAAGWSVWEFVRWLKRPSLDDVVGNIVQASDLDGSAK